MNYKFNLGNINIKGKALEASGIEQFQLENISVEISDANPMEMVQASREFFGLMKEVVSYFEEKEEEDRLRREGFTKEELSFPDEEEEEMIQARKDHEAYAKSIQREIASIREGATPSFDKSKLFWA